MSVLDAAALSDLIAALAARIEAERDRLNRLDAALGDGDHGTAIGAGFTVAVETIAALDELTPSAIWLITAKALMNRTGGASGAVFGTFFLRCVPLLRDVDSLGKAEMGGLLRAGLEGVKARGKAEPGDKTMVDALEPAVLAFEAADDYAAAWSAAAGAARAGADSTRDLVAQRGRAKYLGERAIGHIDPGAMTVALMFESVRDWWHEPGRSGGAR